MPAFSKAPALLWAIFKLIRGKGRVAKNILRLEELVNIISRQQVIVPEQKVRALRLCHLKMQPSQGPCP